MNSPGTKVYSKTVSVQADSYHEAIWKGFQQVDYTQGFFPGHKVQAEPREDPQNPGNYLIDIEVFTPRR